MRLRTTFFLAVLLVQILAVFAVNLPTGDDDRADEFRRYGLIALQPVEHEVATIDQEHKWSARFGNEERVLIVSTAAGVVNVAAWWLALYVLELIFGPMFARPVKTEALRALSRGGL